MNAHRFTLTAGTLALAVGAAALLPAQERPDRPDRRQRGQNARPAPQDARPAQQNARPMQKQNRRNDEAGKLKPTGFIQIAADYDGDGEYDAVETVYALDYVAARDASRRRMSRVSQRPRKVDGELSNLKKIELSGYGGPHLVGRVKTDRGTVAKVDFGPAAQIKPLGLTEGDRVDVEGRRGRINDRAMLLATKVSSDGNTVQIDRPKPSGLRRVKGEVTGLSTKQFRGQIGESVIAELRLVSGREVTANLGSELALAPLDIEQGDEVSLIARPGSINDQPALIASRVYSDGQAVYTDAHGAQERANKNDDRRN